MAILQTLSSEWPTILSFLILTYVVHYYIQYYKRENPLPGPLPLPIIGNLHQAGGDMTEFFARIQRKYGDMFEVYLGGRIIVLTRADLLERVFGNSGNVGKSFLLRCPPNEGLDEFGVTTKGLFFNKHLDAWKFNRKFLSQTMMTPRFLKQFVVISQQVFEEMESYWKVLSDEQGTKELRLQFPKWTAAYTTDTTIHYVTGSRVHLLANYFNSLVEDEQKKSNHPKITLQESIDYNNSLKMLSQSAMFFMTMPRLLRHYVPILSHYNQKSLENMKWFESQNLKLIRERKEEIENTKDDEELSPNTLTLLLTTNTDRDLNRISKGKFSKALTDEEIAANFIEIFTGGIESVSTTLCSTIYYICHNPQVKQKLSQELNSLNMPEGRAPSYEQLDNLKYLEAIIHESIRLLPPAPVVSRCSTEETTIANMKFPAGTFFFANVKGLHHHSQYWESPSKFDPDRFFLNKDKIVKSSFLGFGGGPRNCPGQHLGMIEIKNFLSMLYLKYDVELVDKEAPLKSITEGITLCKELKVFIKPKVK